MAIARVEAVFQDINSFTTTFSESAKSGAQQMSDIGKATLSGLGSGFNSAKKGVARFSWSN